MNRKNGEYVGVVYNQSRIDEDQNCCVKLPSRMELRSHTRSHTATHSHTQLQENSCVCFQDNRAAGHTFVLIWTQRGTAEMCMHISYSQTQHTHDRTHTHTLSYTHTYSHTHTRWWQVEGSEGGLFGGCFCCKLQRSAAFTWEA